MQAIIIGAGIGGLVLALRLNRLGVEVKIFESVKQISPIGAGINLLPHATRELAELGILNRLKSKSIQTSSLHFYTSNGKLILSDPRGINAGYKWPQLSIHRGELQKILLDEVNKLIGSDNIYFGHELYEFHQNTEKVIATFHNKNMEHKSSSFTADVMFGCDGIHSVVRKSFYPDEGELKYSGVTMYRGLTYMEPFLDGKSMLSLGHWDLKLIIYPISPKDSSTGKVLVNWVAEVRGKKMIAKACWNKAATVNNFSEYYKNWNINIININELFQNAEKIIEFPMVDRDPVQQWSFNRTTLVGDAAHPMYPIGSNGASQAILDASSIENALILNKMNVKDSLIMYENERITQTSEIVNSNRKLGPEYILEMVHKKCGLSKGKECTCDNKVACISQKKLLESFEMYKMLAGFSKYELEKKGEIVIKQP